MSSVDKIKWAMSLRDPQYEALQYFDAISSKIEYRTCLWKTFLNQTLKARHNVAHGISFDNTMSIEEIKNTREKIVILEKLFAVLIFKYGIKEIDI